MLNILGFDLETSLGDEKLFKAESKDPNNDFYTLIYGTHPDKEITLEHREKGFNRQLPPYLFFGVDVVVGHNIGFDMGYVWKTEPFQRYMRRQGQIWCTAQAEYLLSGKRHHFPSLAEVQLKHLGEKTKESRISWCFSNGIGAERIIKAKDRCPRLWKLYERYCRDDVRSVLKVFASQYRQARELGILDNILAHMQGLLGVVAISNTGMNLDIPRCENKLRDFNVAAMDYLEKASALVEDMWDSRLKKFNINSPQHKSAILFGGKFLVKEKQQVGVHKNGNPKFTKMDVPISIKGFGLSKSLTSQSKVEGRYTTDRAVMDKVAKTGTDDRLKQYCSFQKKAMNYGKMASTYLIPFLKYNVKGVLYPKYNTTLTVTGRLSSSQPNMQNIPSSGEMVEAVQGNLVAPEGYIAVSIDYNQLEPFTTALLTEDYALAQDLLNGVCLHCRAVSWIPRMSEGKTYEEIYQLAVVEKQPDWVLKRKKAKAINFKRAYGGGARGLAEAENLEVEDVQAVFDAQDAAYPQVKEFNESLFSKLKETQQVSRKTDFRGKDLAGRQFEYGVELLPIFSKEIGDKPEYRAGEYRHYGVFTSRFGDVWTFEEVGRIDKWGRLHRGYSTTQTKNYHIQGTAGLIVEMAMAECLQYTLKHSEDVRMVRQIHDELGFYVRKGKESEHIPAICAIMSNVRWLFKKYLRKDVSFDFKVEAKVGANFADMEIYDDRV